MSASPRSIAAAPLFELDGPLPAGNTILEASAGTGKTYTIAALATRYVASGLPIDRLLVVTFTRLATGELRDRVRERLADSERTLTRVLAGGEHPSDDPLLDLLCTGNEQTVSERRDRLTHAVTNFDRATIETTHSFCQRMLAELGTLGDHEPGVRFVDEVDELLGEVVYDLYVQLFSTKRSVAPIGLEQALRIARARARDPRATLYPLAPDERTPAALRQWLAERSCRELETRKRRSRVMTHEDQLTRLAAVLSGPNGARAAVRLRERFEVVLIDEFQDTDPVQWEILRRAFADGPGTLVLIGDPKQAIYSFRGGDVYTYLAAARHLPNHATLVRNHRSDQPLLSALNTLFANVRLGDPEIPYRPLQAAAANASARITGARPQAPLRVRIIDSKAAIARTTSGAYFETGSARSFVAEDVAGDIAAQLDAAITISDAVEDPSASEITVPRPLAPGDIAVLVREHRQADEVHTALIRRGVPAVISGGGSVFLTKAAEDWMALLDALQRPSDNSSAAHVALSAFIAWDGAQLALADETEMELLHLRLHRWARVLRERGVAAMTATIIDSEQLPARLLGQRGGDRRLTDIQHISELLHRRASQQQLGLAALANWLRERIRTATGGRAGEELERRLDSDAAAVHVLTIHAAKGLEFPIVYCPYLWNGRKYEISHDPISFHGDDGSSARAIDVALEGDEFEHHARRHLDEERAEDLRLLYVALTRARHQAVLWWTGGTFYAFESPLGRLLFAADAQGNIAAKFTGKRPTEQTVATRLRELAAQSGGTIELERADVSDRHREFTVTAPATKLERASFDHDLDLDWRRTSYSALTAAAHEYPAPGAVTTVASEPDGGEIIDDERSRGDAEQLSATETRPSAGERNSGQNSAPPTPITPTAPFTPTTPLPLDAMAAGPALGTIVHRALELVEFDCDDLEGALAQALREANVAAEQVLGCPVEVAAHGLALALATPLGSSFGSRALTSLDRRDRLDELVFELPLAGGDRPRQDLGLAQIADVVERYLPAGDRLAGYPAQLRQLNSARQLRGFLTGTIDLVARTTDPDSGRARYHVLDYKTNRLAAIGTPLCGDHYRPSALTAEMQRSHYLLQGLLYCVAMHRYLRWRVRDYDPARDLGGMHYLFLRGMTGPAETTRPSDPVATHPSDPAATARPVDPAGDAGPSGPAQQAGADGLFTWQPQAELILRLSEVIDGA